MKDYHLLLLVLGSGLCNKWIVMEWEHLFTPAAAAAVCREWLVWSGCEVMQWESHFTSHRSAISMHFLGTPQWYIRRPTHVPLAPKILQMLPFSFFSCLAILNHHFPPPKFPYLSPSTLFSIEPRASLHFITSHSNLITLCFWQFTLLFKDHQQQSAILFLPQEDDH